MARLTEGTDEIRALAADTKWARMIPPMYTCLTPLRFLEEAELAVGRSADAYDKMTDAAGMLESPAADANQLLAELRQLDQALRNDLTFLVDTKVRCECSQDAPPLTPAHRTHTHTGC
jgi:hypothetical protein